MGMRTTIYGYIEEMDLWRDPVRSKIRKHNADVIRSLPIADPWPPLSREMFATTTNYKRADGPNLEYQGRIFHFGANLKSVEQEWGEWRLKFESLLARLYFLEAKVHVHPEYMLAATSTWMVDLLKYQVHDDGSMPSLIRPEYVDYEGSELDTMYGL